MHCRLLITLCVCLLLSSAATHGDDFNIYLKYATFDPLIAEPAVPADLRTTPISRETEYFLVQFDGPVVDEWTQGLTALGADVVSYIPNYTFLVMMTPEQAAKARSLPHVRWVGAFHAAYKLDPSIAAGQGTLRARVNVRKGGDASGVRKEIERLGGVVQDQGTVPDRPLAATLPAKALAKIAHLKDVDWIEPKPEYKLFNNVARGILNAPTVWSDLGLYGAGEVVAVCDTGLDTGDTTTLSLDFAGRLTKTYPLGRPGNPKRGIAGDWSDLVGHGTHVCGSVLGSGALSGSNASTHSYASSFAGAAPEASLIMQSVADSSGNLSGIPSDLNNLFSPVYTDGARIHSDSWGSTATGQYTTDSHNVDQFMWNNKDFLVLLAAGNDGVDANGDGIVDTNSLSSPGSAKNCITVGATENLRPSGGLQVTYGGAWPSDYPAAPINGDYVSNNASGMAAFSSRGPAADGRIKPDVVAPGTSVISSRSHASGAGTLWAVYNSDYVYSGGTSMATPLVAGSAALARQYYRTVKSVASPTAALIKATLINGATDLYPGQYGTGQYIEEPSVRPNAAEGWGRVDLAYVLSPTAPRSLQFVDSTTGLSTNGSVTYSYYVTGNSSPLRITLVWTDYPAAASASKALINDLDLTVAAPDLTLWTGNGTADHLNNVEEVDIPNPIPGVYSVKVAGFNVPSHGPQPFALVATAAFGQAAYTITASAATGGSISPSGAVSVDFGTNKTFTIAANAGDVISDVVVDGVSQGPLASYTFNNVMANHTISASFITAAQSVASIAAVKAEADGTLVNLTGTQTVIYAPKNSGGTRTTTFFYVGEAKALGGLKVVDKTSDSLTLGNRIAGGLTGYVRKPAGGEVYLELTADPTGSGSSPIPPIGVGCRSVLSDPHVPTNTVVTWGKVKSINGVTSFTINDGYTGDVTVNINGVALPTGFDTTKYAIISGVLSADKTVQAQTIRIVP